MADNNFIVKNGLVVNTAFAANSTVMSLGTINSTTNSVFITPSSITIGNTTVNTTISSVAFTGLAYTANNTTYVNNKTEGNLNVNNATYAGGLAITSGRNNVANQIVRTDASGYTQFGYIASSSGNENNASNPSRVWGTNGSDDYFRTYRTSSLSVASAVNATYLSGTQQTSVILGTSASLAMSGDSTYNGSFICRSGGTGDGNLAGLSFWNDAYAIKLGVRADGVFGLGGWSSTAWRWYSSPNGDMLAAGNVTAYSDPRLKENFKKINNPLDIIKALDGGTFNWKHGFEHTQNKAGKKDYGILADQVESVMPEIVSESIEIEGDRYKTVAYEKLVPVLIEAIKELEKRVAELEAK